MKVLTTNEYQKIENRSKKLMKIETNFTVGQKFSMILKTEKKLNKYKDCASDKDKAGYDMYFVIQDHLKKQLVELLYTDFTTLSKEKFLHLCDLVSSHRPVQPFSFLVSISNRKK